MILTELKSGMKIPIYTDYKECKGFEGEAILIEKVSNGDSFYLSDEIVKVSEKKTYTKEEKEKISKYNRIKYFFYGKSSPPEKDIVKLRKKLIKLRKDLEDDYFKMESLLNKERKKYENSVYKIKSLFDDFNNDYIIRFIQQDREKWNPTIFNYERWIVQFITDSSGWSTNFRTQRNIRILIKYNPNETTRGSDIRKYTTYNSIPSLSVRREENKKLYQEEDLGDFIDDNDFEELIKNKIK